MLYVCVFVCLGVCVSIHARISKVLLLYAHSTVCMCGVLEEVYLVSVAVW